MIVRIKIALPQSEYSALMKLALAELRTPEHQLHYILRETLKHHGLFSFDDLDKVSKQVNSSISRKDNRNESNKTESRST